MRLATSTSDFSGYAETPEGLLDIFAKTPFRYVDLDCPHDMAGADWQHTADRLGNRAAALGLTFVQAHAGDFYLGGPRTGSFHADNICNALRLCRVLSIPQIVVHAQYTPFIPYDGGDSDRQADFRIWNKSLYDQLIPTMEETGVRVLVENSAEQNCGPWCYFMTGAELSAMVDALNHPLFGAVWDIGHANLRHNDQYTDITALGDRLLGVHIQDNDSRCDEHTAPFMGTTDMDAVLQGLADIEYRGYFTFECFNFPLRGGSWPHTRKATASLPHPRRLTHASADLKVEAATWLWHCGRFMLEQYGLFEE